MSWCDNVTDTPPGKSSNAVITEVLGGMTFCVKLLNYLRLCGKKVTMFSLSGFKPFLFFVDMLPAVLNKCSEAELKAQIHKILFSKMG